MPEGEGFITMEAMKGLMEIQERAFRSIVEIMFNGLKNDIKENRKDVQGQAWNSAKQASLLLKKS